MLRCISASFLIGIVFLFTSSAPTFAASQTCTERQEVCFAYCEKTYKNSPKCINACKAYLGICLSTGCWESKVSAKRCSFVKR